MNSVISTVPFPDTGNYLQGFVAFIRIDNGGTGIRFLPVRMSDPSATDIAFRQMIAWDAV